MVRTLVKGFENIRYRIKFPHYRRLPFIMVLRISSFLTIKLLAERIKYSNKFYLNQSNGKNVIDHGKKLHPWNDHLVPSKDTHLCHLTSLITKSYVHAWTYKQESTSCLHVESKYKKQDVLWVSPSYCSAFGYNMYRDIKTLFICFPSLATTRCVSMLCLRPPFHQMLCSAK